MLRDPLKGREIILNFWMWAGELRPHPKIQRNPRRCELLNSLYRTIVLKSSREESIAYQGVHTLCNVSIVCKDHRIFGKLIAIIDNDIEIEDSRY